MKQNFLKLKGSIVRISTITAICKEYESSKYCVHIHYGYADDYLSSGFESEAERDREYDRICKLLEEDDSSSVFCCN